MYLPNIIYNFIYISYTHSWKPILCVRNVNKVDMFTTIVSRTTYLLLPIFILTWTVCGKTDGKGVLNDYQYFSFQPVLHDWCNKGRGMCYPVCGMVHIKEPLLLLEKSSPCGGSGFPLSLSEWSFTICLTPI